MAARSAAILFLGFDFVLTQSTVAIKPLLGLVFNSRECCNTLVNWDYYKNRFFESLPLAGFQKTDIGVSNAEGCRNTNIGFIIRIDNYLDNISSLTGATPEEIRPITLAAAVEISITRPWA